MARKKVKIDNSVSASVPLSSMIDIVFLLLIYFITTQKEVINDVHLQLDLPDPTAAGSSAKASDILEIGVFYDPADNFDKINEQMARAKTEAERKAYEKRLQVFYSYRGARLEFSNVVEQLKNIRELNPDTTIMINCGPNAKHQKLIKLLDLCDELGLRKLNLVNDDSIKFDPGKHKPRPQ